MQQEKVIENAIKFVKEILKNAEGGHDWFHIDRVLKNAILISKEEKVDPFIVSLGALFHDIADPKFHHGDETIGPKITNAFLRKQQVDEVVINHVLNIIKHISFKNSLEDPKEIFNSSIIKTSSNSNRSNSI